MHHPTDRIVHTLAFGIQPFIKGCIDIIPEILILNQHKSIVGP